MEIHCERCGCQLKRQGGLLFGPPDDNKQVEKIHLCGWCHMMVVQYIRVPPP